MNLVLFNPILSPKKHLFSELENSEYREAFVSSTINNCIAYQSRMLRKKYGWDQIKLGAMAGMRQTVISRVENPDYGNLTLNTLKRLAKAFNVGLLVRFCTFGEMVDWSTSFSQQDLNVQPFHEELEETRARELMETAKKTADGIRSETVGAVPLCEPNPSTTFSLVFRAAENNLLEEDVRDALLWTLSSDAIPAQAQRI